jgi:AcrR family transcriptional regulator
MTSTTKMTKRTSVTGKTPTRTDRRSVRNRKALLDAAAKLIAATGLEQVTIDEITESADLAKGTFYHYFNDRNDIAKELALIIRREIREQVGVAADGLGDPAGQLIAGIAVCLRAAAVTPTRAAVLGRMYSLWLSPSANKEFRLFKYLETGYRSGRFSAGDLPVAVVLTVGIVEAGITHALQLAEWNAIRKLAAALSALVLRALGLKGSDAQAVAEKIIAQVFNRDFEVIARANYKTDQAGS